MWKRWRNRSDIQLEKIDPFKLIYIIDPTPYDLSHGRSLNPLRMLNFLPALKHGDEVIVPSSIRRETLERLSYFQSIGLISYGESTLRFIDDTKQPVMNVIIDQYEEYSSFFNEKIILLYNYSEEGVRLMKLSGYDVCDFSLIYKINDKHEGYMFFKSKQIPLVNRIIAKSQDSIIREFDRWTPKYRGIVIKMRQQESGDGNFFCSERSQIQIIINKNNLDNELRTNGLVVEPWLPKEAMYFNYQYLLLPNSEGIFLGCSKQFMWGRESEGIKHFVFLGSIWTSLDRKNKQIADKVARSVQQVGYVGFIGVDIYQIGRIRGLMEVNCRCNFATPFFLLSLRKNHRMAKFFWHMEDIFLTGEDKTFSYFVKKIRILGYEYDKELNQGVILLSFQNTSAQCLFVGNDPDHVFEMRNKVFNLAVQSLIR